MKEIVLVNNRGITLIDDDDYDLIKNYKFCLSTNGYAYCNNWNNKRILLHRIIINVQYNQIIDHINRNKLDNRKENLRITNRLENFLNSDSYDKSKGYFWNKSNNKWRAVILRNGKTYHLGYFLTEEEAKIAVKNARCARDENITSIKRKVRGYFFDKSRNKWVATIKQTRIGRFNTEDEAKEAYEKQLLILAE